jgi:hypothetical protein
MTCELRSHVAFVLVHHAVTAHHSTTHATHWLHVVHEHVSPSSDDGPPVESNKSSNQNNDSISKSEHDNRSRFDLFFVFGPLSLILGAVVVIWVARITNITIWIIAILTSNSNSLTSNSNSLVIVLLWCVWSIGVVGDIVLLQISAGNISITVWIAIKTLLAEISGGPVIVVLIKLLVGFVGLPEFIKCENDNEEDDEVNDDVRDEHALEALTNLVPISERVHVHPLEDPEEGVDGRKQHQKLNENVPLFVDGLDYDVDDCTNNSKESQEE